MEITKQQLETIYQEVANEFLSILKPALVDFSFDEKFDILDMFGKLILEGDQNEDYSGLIPLYNSLFLKSYGKRFDKIDSLNLIIYSTLIPVFEKLGIVGNDVFNKEKLYINNFHDFVSYFNQYYFEENEYYNVFVDAFNEYKKELYLSEDNPHLKVQEEQRFVEPKVNNKDFTQPRRALAIIYILRAFKRYKSNTNNSAIARLIMFLTGLDPNEYKNHEYYKIINQEKPFKRSKKKLIDDLEYIKQYFVDLQLSEVIDEINKDLMDDKEI